MFAWVCVRGGGAHGHGGEGRGNATLCDRGRVPNAHPPPYQGLPEQTPPARRMACPRSTVPGTRGPAFPFLPLGCACVPRAAGCPMLVGCGRAPLPENAGVVWAPRGHGMAGTALSLLRGARFDAHGKISGADTTLSYRQAQAQSQLHWSGGSEAAAEWWLGVGHRRGRGGNAVGMGTPRWRASRCSRSAPKYMVGVVSSLRVRKMVGAP
jgi:hypothetical protein